MNAACISDGGPWPIPVWHGHSVRAATAADHDQFVGELSRIMAVSSGVRRNGAAALDLAWVAAGRLDGFWERGLSTWDIAAGVLLVREAGGFISDFASRDKALESGDVVAANPGLHGDLIKRLRG